MASSICSRAARAILVAAFAVATAGPARADEPGADEAARSAARAKLVEGVDALGRGDHRRALEKFEQAYALVPSPKIHYDFGLAYLGLGRRAEALTAFERFLAEAPDAPADKREKAVQRTAALRPQVGAATITVAGARDSATITVDGHEVGHTPLPNPIYLDPGRHEVSVRLPDGGQGPLQTIDVVPGGTVEVALRLPSDPLAPRSGSVGQRARESGPDLLIPPAQDKPAASAPIHTRRIVALSIGAAGVALIGAGVTFGVLAKRESDSLSNDSATSAAPENATAFDPEKEARGTRYQTLQVISLVAGAVGLASGIVLYATTRGRATVEPVAVRGLAGANLQVRF